MSTYNTPVYTAQNGTTLNVASGGTLNVAGQLILGGTAGRWAFGEAVITAGGSVFVSTGLTTVVSAVATPLVARAAVNAAAGTYEAKIDTARFANGSITVLSVTNGTVTPGGGSVAWVAFGV